MREKLKKYAKHANKGRKQVVFEPGDWVWIQMRKERFLAQRTSKLQPRGGDPFQVLSIINDNAYMIDLPSDYGMSNTFNVSNLSSCVAGADGFNSRSNSLREEGDNEDNVKSMDLEAEHGFDGPITRARAKEMVNEAQFKMENVKPQPKLVNCLRNKENELTLRKDPRISLICHLGPIFLFAFFIIK